MEKVSLTYQIKNEEETYEQIIEMGRNIDYTTGNLLDYEHFSNRYKLITIDSSKQIELENPDLKQQINFIESGKVKHELRVTSSNPQATSSNPGVASSNSQATSSNL